MSNIIPPLLSDTPPPPPDIDDHEDDEFGDFTGTNNLSYDYEDSFSPPGSPVLLPTEHFELDEPHPTEITDINSNSKENITEDLAHLDKPKDFRDKRKDIESRIVELSKTTIDDQQTASSDNTAPVSLANQESLNKNQELNELKSEEIIVTNCDTKTTSSQEEINNISSGKEELFSKSIQSNSSDDDFNDFASPSGRDDTANLSIGTKNSDVTLDDNSVAPGPLKQLDNNTLISVEHKQVQQAGSEVGNLNKVTDTLKTAREDNDDEIFSPSMSVFENREDNAELLSKPVVCTLGELSNNTFDFGAFVNDTVQVEFSSLPSNLNTQNDCYEETKNTSLKVSDIDFDEDFGDFAVNNSGISGNSPKEHFEDFANFSPDPKAIDDDDDFGDFATNPVTSSEDAQNSKIMLLNEKQALDKSTEIVREMFPVIEKHMGDFVYNGLEANDKIFNQVKNVTDTHALSFQWPKSASQKLLLKALNIDSRNILYGPGWNPSMPRFAANLSMTPLEPVKSEILTPIPAKEMSTSNSSQTKNGEALQVDLNAMELPDPLDYLEQLVSQLENLNVKNTSMSHNSSSPANEFEDWEAWLEANPTKAATNSASKEPLSTVTLEPVVLHSEQKATPTIVHDDFDDFVSYSSPAVQESPHRHSIILRETHISNKEPAKGEENDIVSWLEPTIVTPELARKEREFMEADEEFDDFQMVVVPEEQISKPVDLTVKPLEILRPQSVAALDTDFNETSRTQNKDSKSLTNDDDFGDFTFSLPNEIKKPENTFTVKPTTPVQPLIPAPLLEPLKPSVVPSHSASSSISWPDPGITDDEISRLEALGYARVQKKQPVNEHMTKPPVVNQKSKQNSLDDEEWSDFVSGQNSSPIHKLKTEKERSSTPDLPLSVLNLGSVQPAKQPIPVITPNGLVQTKLSSNMSLNFPNMMQQTNRVYPQPQLQNNAAYQPSIISNQYASQAYGGFSNYQAQNVVSAPSKTNGDDDEWSDFVSHEPTVQKTSQSRASQPYQLSSWINSTPNIIANPAASFDLFSGPGVPKQVKKVSGPAQSRRSAAGVPSVSVPDLDFLAPRNRTTQRK